MSQSRRERSETETVWRRIRSARELLKNEGVAAIPTETVYGLAGSIRSERAIRSIFEEKARPFFDPLIVHVGRPSQLKEIACDIPPIAFELTRRFWPGPLTLVLPKRPEINSLITAGLDTVAIRMPRHPLALRLLRTLDTPLAAPSANRFGKTSPTSAEHVREEFGDKIFVLDGGPCEVGVESTVVEIEAQSLTILRRGLVSAAELEKTASLFGAAVSELAEHARAPGHTPQHYMPDIPLITIDGPRTDLDAAAKRKISTGLNLNGAEGSELVLPLDPIIAARRLYASLRDLSKQPIHFIYLFWTPEMRGELWDAIWDRVSRASSRILNSESIEPRPEG